MLWGAAIQILRCAGPVKKQIGIDVLYHQFGKGIGEHPRPHHEGATGYFPVPAYLQGHDIPLHLAQSHYMLH